MILSGGDIKAWAERIRQDKIVELSSIIKEKKDAIKNTDFNKEDYMSPRRVHLLSDISRLERKLKYITQ